MTGQPYDLLDGGRPRYDRHPHPKPPRPRPQPHAVPRPRRMTIAVGIVSPLFLIVAADSQETWGTIKRPSRKIHIGTMTRRARGSLFRGRIALTGAGGSNYLDYLQDRIIGGIQKKTSGKLTNNVQRVTEAEMTDFYVNHYVPVAYMESHRDEEPGLIIGAVMGAERGLWRAVGNVVRHTQMGYEVVGIGEVWARAVLDSSVSFLSNEHAATLTACYAIYSAKEMDGYCGKDTHIASLRPVGKLLRWADPDAVLEAERVFRKYDELQEWMLNAIVTPPNRPVKFETDQKLAAIRADLNAIDFYPN
jgi:hypothetical protein